MGIKLFKGGELVIAQPVTIFTIGHSNMTIEEFLAMCDYHGIQTIVDVRSSPSSRYVPWVNRDVVGPSLREGGKRYIYGGKVLGGFAKDGVGDDNFLEKLGKVVEIGKTEKVAMMCSEKKPADCHRAYKLTSTIHRKWKHVGVFHLVEEKQIDARMFELAKPLSFVSDYHSTHLTDAD